MLSVKLKTSKVKVMQSVILRFKMVNLMVSSLHLSGCTVKMLLFPCCMEKMNGKAKLSVGETSP